MNWYGYPKPKVFKTLGGVWITQVTRGFSGNYENEYTHWPTWREAFDHAHNAVRRWRR